jgi:ATP-binding cassette subfamily C protein CydC
MTNARSVAQILGRFTRIYPWRLVAGIVLVAAATAAGLGLLAVAGDLIAGAALAGAGLIVFDTFRPSALVRLFAVVRTAARYAERLATHDATLRFVEAMRVDAFLGLAREFRGTERPAVLFNRLTGDLDALDGILVRLAIPVAAGLLVLVGTAVALWAIAPAVAVATVAPVAVGGILAPLFVARPAARHMRVKLAALDAARGRIAELDRGRASLAASGALAARTAEATATVDRAAAADRRLATLDAALRLAVGLGSTAAIVGAALAGLAAVAAGSLDPQGFAMVVLVAFALPEAVAPLRTVAVDQGRWTVAARRVAPILEAADRAGPVTPAGRVGAPAIALAGIRVGSGARVRLDAVDLAVPAGAVVALVGPSGSGKSTLLTVIEGRIVPDAGRVTIDPPAPRVAALGQRTELFRGTVAENLRLARRDATDGRLAAVLAAARLDGVLGADGADRRLGDEGSGLSGGERRRLALARTMLTDPDLVLLDEPTEGLDAATAAAVFDEILAWARGRTLVLATHRPEEAARADIVCAVEDGRVRLARTG